MENYIFPATASFNKNKSSFFTEASYRKTHIIGTVQLHVSTVTNNNFHVKNDSAIPIIRSMSYINLNRVVKKGFRSNLDDE